MPLKRCAGGKGWQWGDKGKCYTGPGAKKKAIKQALAENDGVFPKGEASVSEAELEEATAEFRAEQVGDGVSRYIASVAAYMEKPGSGEKT